MPLGENIKKYRKLRGLTQADLAERANISRSYLADVERNRYHPSISTLLEIASALNVSLAELFGLPENFELYERLRLILMELSEGPINNRQFPSNVVMAIKNEAEYIKKIYNVEFEYTPDGISEICYKVNDDYFTVEIIRMLERVKEKTTIPPWATKKDVRDFKKMLEEDVPVMFDGVPLDDEDREKVKKVLEAIFWDAKKKNKRKSIED